MTQHEHSDGEQQQQQQQQARQLQQQQREEEEAAARRVVAPVPPPVVLRPGKVDLDGEPLVPVCVFMLKVRRTMEPMKFQLLKSSGFENVLSWSSINTQSKQVCGCVFVCMSVCAIVSLYVFGVR